MNAKISKLGTAQLQKAIDAGKFEGQDLKDAKATLAKRTQKPAGAKSTEAPAKKEKVKPGKKEKVEPEAAAEKTLADYKKDGVSGLVRKMLTPTDGSTIAGCSFSEASKKVKEKFGRALYPSEFDRSFKILANLGVLTERRAPQYRGIKKDA